MGNTFTKEKEKEKDKYKLSKFESSILKLKVIMIGDCGVGKSAMIERYINNSFDRRYKSTIGVDYVQKEYKLVDPKTNKPINCILSVWDTAGQEKFRAIRGAYYKNIDAIVLCFDISDSDTFNNINYWIEEIKLYTDDTDIKLIICGNKCDLYNKYVFDKDIDKLKKKHNFTYFEVSALKNINVNTIFDYIVDTCTEMPRRNNITNDSIVLLNNDSQLNTLVTSINNYFSNVNSYIKKIFIPTKKDEII
jgi:small GTP-binding protein